MVQRPVNVGDLAGIRQGEPEVGSSSLVLLHGLTFEGRQWQPVLQQLGAVEPARDVLALDLPGHGESRAAASYRLDDVVDAVHFAVTFAGIERPVLVGHSISAVIATIYASRYDVAAVVNVDQSLRVGPFARLVQSLEPRLRGPEFATIWPTFSASMYPELLPADAQAIVASTSRPRQDVVLGYWHDALSRAPESLELWVDGVLADVRRRDTPYLLVTGTELEPDERQWLTTHLPHCRIEVFLGSGHFPHLAHPDRFARSVLGVDNHAALSTRLSPATQP